MKSTRTEPDPHPRWNSPNTDATNSSGFSAFPGGQRHGGPFGNMGAHGFWWSTFENYPGSSFAYRWYLVFNGSYVGSGEGNKSYGYSVRCVRD
jgi:uncharacterized protein (TIGR02145 family)